MKNVLFLICLSMCCSSVFSQTNLVTNYGFDILSSTTPNPKGYCHTPGSSHWADATPAQNWAAWINNPTDNSCMIMEVVNLKSRCYPPAPPASSGAGGNVMHITSTIGHSGIAQNPLPDTKSVRVTCWVYVVRGKVGIGAGNAGATTTTGVSTTTCKWEKLTTTNSTSPANNVCIYSMWTNVPMADGAEFYVDNVIVEKL